MIMDIPVNWNVYMQGGNQSVLTNTTILYLTLNNNSQSTAYHFVHEIVMRDDWRNSNISTHVKEADLLTKQLPTVENHKGVFEELPSPHLP